MPSCHLTLLLLLCTSCVGVRSGQERNLEGPEMAEEGSLDAKRVRRVHVQTRDVFSGEDAQERPLYRLVNGIHVTTREAVIRREMWFEEGSYVTPGEAQELERNLRGMGLFGDVTVELEQLADGQVDVLVRTRDRLSLNTGAGGFFVGGVGGVQANIGENNLFGKGDRISASYRRNSNDETEASLSYTDIHFLDTDYRLRGSIGDTEEGNQYSLGLTKPFKNLQDPFSWGASGFSGESDVDFYESGDTVAEVPQERATARLFVAKAEGPPELRRTLGLSLALEDTQYGAAVGPQAGTIDVPGDLSKLTVGPYGRFDRNIEFRKVTELDSLDGVEDLELGWQADWLVGGVLRDEEGSQRRTQPVILANVRGAMSPASETYVTYSTGGTLRWYAGEAQGWNISGAVHAYHKLAGRQTLAASLTFERVFEIEDLPPQLTLGEDNGLRGYPSREFAGTQVLRLNLEDRIATDLRLRSVHMGLVGFFDSAWIGDGSLGSPKTSVGVGLRFGSSELFGRGVIRVDFAVPLQEENGQDYSPSVSISLGQVFSFFGNSSSLPGR